MRRSRKQLIVHVTPYYPPHLGGMENAVANMASTLARKGADVIVLTSSMSAQPGIHQERIGKGSLRIERLSCTVLAHTPIMHGLSARLKQLPASAVIHVHTGVAWVPDVVRAVCTRQQRPYIAHVHLEPGASGPAGILLPAYRTLFFKRVLADAAAIIVLSSEYEKAIVIQYNVASSKVFVVPNGVSKEHFLHRSRDMHTPPRLLFVGRLAVQKRVDFLLNALTYLRTPVVLTVVGTGPLERALRTQSEKVMHAHPQHTIIFRGPRRGKQLLHEYRNADIFTLTSDREGLPLVLLEAMAAGLVIVATDVLGTRSFVKHDGILVRQDSPRAFASALESIFLDRNKRRIVRQRGLQRARKLTWEHVCARLQTIYQRVSRD